LGVSWQCSTGPRFAAGVFVDALLRLVWLSFVAVAGAFLAGRWLPGRQPPAQRAQQFTVWADEVDGVACSKPVTPAWA
jgi:hypothetical protein